MFGGYPSFRRYPPRYGRPGGCRRCCPLPRWQRRPSRTGAPGSCSTSRGRPTAPRPPIGPSAATSCRKNGGSYSARHTTDGAGRDARETLAARRRCGRSARLAAGDAACGHRQNGDRRLSARPTAARRRRRLMAHALEVRVPFVDHRLAGNDLAGARPSSQTCSRASTCCGRASPECPAVSAAGPKRGFTLPFETWMRGGLREPTLRGIESSVALGWVNARAAAAVWSDWERGRAHWSRVWSLSVFGSVPRRRRRARSPQRVARHLHPPGRAGSVLHAGRSVAVAGAAVLPGLA